MANSSIPRSAPAIALGILTGLAALCAPPAPASGQDTTLDGRPQVLAGPALPASLLFSSTSGQFGGYRRRFNLDTTLGPFIPIEAGEDYEVGWTYDLKFQAEVVRYLFLGGEFAYAWNDKDPSSLFFDGWLNRFYFLVPIEVDIPFAGPPENPFSVRFGVAPGIQLVVPEVDPDVEDAFKFFNGVKPEEDDFVAFNLRLRVGLRFPVNPHFGFLFEVAYDWAEGTAHTRFKDLNTGATVQPVTSTVNLCGVSVMFGMQWVF